MLAHPAHLSLHIPTPRHSFRGSRIFPELHELLRSEAPCGQRRLEIQLDGVTLELTGRQTAHKAWVMSL